MMNSMGFALKVLDLIWTKPSALVSHACRQLTPLDFRFWDSVLQSVSFIVANLASMVLFS